MTKIAYHDHCEDCKNDQAPYNSDWDCIDCLKKERDRPIDNSVKYHKDCSRCMDYTPHNSRGQCLHCM